MKKNTVGQLRSNQLQHLISKRAYELSQQNSNESELNNWLQAEKEVYSKYRNKSCLTDTNLESYRTYLRNNLTMWFKIAYYEGLSFKELSFITNHTLGTFITNYSGDEKR